MGTARVHEGIRQMRFEGLLEQQTRGEITQEEAALDTQKGWPAGHPS
jgi:hypothetical protein